ncbi:MAG: RNase adapter RapZ [Granulosicoccus sp.]
MTRVTIVTGLSGSGKSVALHTLEDEGFFCIDNLPSQLLSDIIDKLLASGSGLYERLAIGIDMRSERASADNLIQLLRVLRARQDAEVEVLFLDTDRSTLVTRFSETRRKHPLSTQDLPLIAAIDEEARLLDPVKSEAELVVDTSTLNLHDLRDIIRTYLLGKTKVGLALIFQSFGFKHGTPASTDFMFDVRCLPNPHWEPDLRRHDGREQPIIDFLEEKQDVQEMYNDLQNFVARWLPLFEDENRAYLTVSVGCTGGRHRSVYLIERLFAFFSDQRDNVSRRHREIT